MPDQPIPAANRRHRECGSVVMFDLSGGFCTGCHAENLEPGDCTSGTASGGDGNDD